MQLAFVMKLQVNNQCCAKQKYIGGDIGYIVSVRNPPCRLDK